MAEFFYKDKDENYKPFIPIARIPSEISESIAEQNRTKVGYSEVVDGKLLMYSDSTKSILLATLDLPVGTPTDVQINGTSITQDGVANIPLAGNDVYGAVQGYDGYGVGVNARGYLYPNYPNNAQIDAKNINTRVLTPASTDRVLRAGLISNSQITDDDKPLICQTIGAEPKHGEWENLFNATLTLNTEPVDINIPSCKIAEIYIMSVGGTTNSSYCLFDFFDSDGSGTSTPLTEIGKLQASYDNRYAFVKFNRDELVEYTPWEQRGNSLYLRVKGSALDGYLTGGNMTLRNLARIKSRDNFTGTLCIKIRGVRV